MIESSIKRMSIIITNLGPQTADSGGERLYEVRINTKPVCTFRHFRIDGLAVCLEKAAAAVRKADALAHISSYNQGT